jgi:hypothetical protein
VQRPCGNLLSYARTMPLRSGEPMLLPQRGPHEKLIICLIDALQGTYANESLAHGNHIPTISELLESCRTSCNFETDIS